MKKSLLILTILSLFVCSNVFADDIKTPKAVVTAEVPAEKNTFKENVQETTDKAVKATKEFSKKTVETTKKAYEKTKEFTSDAIDNKTASSAGEPNNLFAAIKPPTITEALLPKPLVTGISVLIVIFKSLGV